MYVNILIHVNVKHTTKILLINSLECLIEKGFRVWLVQAPALRQVQRHLYRFSCILLNKNQYKSISNLF